MKTRGAQQDTSKSTSKMLSAIHVTAATGRLPSNPKKAATVQNISGIHLFKNPFKTSPFLEGQEAVWHHDHCPGDQG